VAVARGKVARKYGRELEAGEVVLVGDTPLDVAAAREGGARAVGVATGPYAVQELEAAGADAVLIDLSDVELVTATLLEI